MAFVAAMMILVRPVMNRVARKCSYEHDVLPEIYVCLTLAGVMLSGFMTDIIGSEFASRMTRRIEDFVSTLLLPVV